MRHDEKRSNAHGNDGHSGTAAQSARIGREESGQQREGQKAKEWTPPVSGSNGHSGEDWLD